MADTRRSSNERPPSLDVPDRAPVAGAGAGPSPAPSLEAGESENLQVIEERLSVGKRRRSTGSVQVGIRTEVVDAVAEAELDRYQVEVTRVPVGRVVDAMPMARSEGDTTIIPIVEERLVVVRRLFVVEELRIRHVIEREATREQVALRRQRVVVERLDMSDRPEPRREGSTDTGRANDRG